MIKVNGRTLDADGKTVGELLTAEGYDRRTVAVERNTEIVPKAAYDSTVLKDGDCVEVVSFVGGG